MVQNDPNQRLNNARAAVRVHEDLCIECGYVRLVTVCLAPNCVFDLKPTVGYQGPGLCAECLTLHFAVHELAGLTWAGKSYDQWWADEEKEYATKTKADNRRVLAPAPRNRNRRAKRSAAP